VSVLENIDEYVLAQNQILEELTRLESNDYQTKTKKIIRLREVTRPLIEAGYYEGIRLADMASFIHRELLQKHKISYNNSGDYYALFKDDEKHIEHNSSRSREKISSPLPLEKQTGDDDIDLLKQYARSGLSMPENYQYHIYLERIIDVSNETIKQSESLIRKLGAAFFFIDKFDKMFPNKKELEIEIKQNSKKSKELAELYDHYKQCENTIESIESGIGSTPDKIEKLEETLANQRHISKQIDERSKITFLEKWNTIVAEIEIGISAIAKKLGVNKKHLTNNVRPRENPVTGVENKHHKYINWFRAIQVTAPNGERFTFDAKEYFDKQIERGKLQVPFEPMVLKNCEL
jgi:hypothetical protein